VLEVGIVLRTEGLTKRFGGLVAVNNVSMEVEEKKLSMIIGPNGSGKTTLINCISGFLPIDGGRIFFKGKEITNLPPHKRVDVGLTRTFQIPSPFGKLSVLDNLLTSYRFNIGERLYYSIFRSKWKKVEEEVVEKALRILKLLNLYHLKDARANTLSGGQLKLLEIGRALMTDADTILMDEPVGGVNPTLAHEIFRHIKNLIENHGKTFLIIEHRLEVAKEYVDHVYAMSMGRIIAEGSPDEVLNDKHVIESYLGTVVV
jgi:branched-chain amino acid transport system ATP-binding protein